MSISPTPTSPPLQYPNAQDRINERNALITELNTAKTSIEKALNELDIKTDSGNFSDNFEKALTDATIAKISAGKIAYTDANDVAINSFTINVIESNIESANNKMLNIANYCRAVHHDIVSIADFPFHSKCTQLTQRAYNLNPSNIKLSKKCFLGIGHSVTLPGIMKSVITDPTLKKNFVEKTKNLDKDKPSKTLEDAIYEAKMMQECIEITKKYEQELQNASPADVEAILNRYAIEIGKTMSGGKAIIKGVIIYDPKTLGKDDPKRDYNAYNNGDGYVYINQNKGGYATGNHKKTMNTVTHEARHQYQYEVADGETKEVSDETKKKAERIKDKNKPKSGTDYPGYSKAEHEEDARLAGSIAVSEIK